jgi:hypothetical protein
MVEGDPRLLIQVRKPDGGFWERAPSIPVNYWYPIREWAIGEVVSVVVDRLAIGWYSHGEVLLSVIEGDNPENAPVLPVTAPSLSVEDGTSLLLTELRRG